MPIDPLSDFAETNIWDSYSDRSRRSSMMDSTGTSNGDAGGDDSIDHSLPSAEEARMNATATAFGMIDHYREEDGAKRGGDGEGDGSNGDEESGVGGDGNGNGNGSGSGSGRYRDNPDEDGDDDEDEEAPINPTAANKEKRKKRYILSYLLLWLRYCAWGIAALAVLVGLFFLIREILHVLQLEKNNKAMTAQIDDMSDRIELLKQGIIEAQGPFKAEELKCTDDLATISGIHDADTSKTSPNLNLPGFYGCVSNDAAATLLEAQSRVQQWSKVEAPTGLVGQTPDWIKRRVPDYGIWLYPRLKLILFSCPKCGNSESRTMLTVLSSMRQRTQVGDANLPDVLNWTVPAGSWEQESTDSWRLAGSFKGGGGKGMTGGDEGTVDAFKLIHELLVGQGSGNGGRWSSLSIVRHPYERFVEAYAEIEALWSRLPDNAPQRKVLDARPFSKMPVGSWERVQAFFADYVLGYLSVKDGPSGCLVPTLPELYNIIPTAPGYLRTGTGSGAYFSADRIISIDQIHSAWPDLLDSWGFTSKDPELVELADVHLNAGGSGSYGYYSGSDAAKAARDLLASDDEFRHSIDAFYAQDFSCFGFQEGQEVLGIAATKKKPPRQPVATEAPTIAPTEGRVDTAPPAPDDPGNGRRNREQWVDDAGNVRF
mmetsp:Transcript_22141/g.48234  ORF Transcript_22141/g.48234 Transcript_22141/m.48234 type:complete len:656 (+) Transcript_22141:173-2140(+)